MIKKIIPYIEFNNYKYKNTFELFQKNKKIMLKALTGAFINSKDLLVLEDLYFQILNDGNIDDIFCIVVNDSDVINAWCSSLNIKNVLVIPDGNADFTKALGMSYISPTLGIRSKEYTIIVKDREYYEDNLISQS